jgi:hypothetical protein
MAAIDGLVQDFLAPRRLAVLSFVGLFPPNHTLQKQTARGTSAPFFCVLFVSWATVCKRDHVLRQLAGSRPSCERFWHSPCITFV